MINFYKPFSTFEGGKFNAATGIIMQADEDFYNINKALGNNYHFNNKEELFYFITINKLGDCSILDPSQKKKLIDKYVR